jgi:hypothetical protein
MGKASEWLREERRKVLGDWVAFCLDCGAARRWFEEFEARCRRSARSAAARCLRRCPSCSEPFSSMFAVDCESCGDPLRAPELLGTKIRRRVIRALATPSPTRPPPSCDASRFQARGQAPDMSVQKRPRVQDETAGGPHSRHTFRMSYVSVTGTGVYETTTSRASTRRSWDRRYGSGRSGGTVTVSSGVTSRL